MRQQQQHQQQHQHQQPPPSPSVVEPMNAPSRPAIQPQNPFDQVVASTPQQQQQRQQQQQQQQPGGGSPVPTSARTVISSSHRNNNNPLPPASPNVLASDFLSPPKSPSSNRSVNSGGGGGSLHSSPSGGTAGSAAVLDNSAGIINLPMAPLSATKTPPPMTPVVDVGSGGRRRTGNPGAVRSAPPRGGGAASASAASSSGLGSYLDHQQLQHHQYQQRRAQTEQRGVHSSAAYGGIASGSGGGGARGSGIRQQPVPPQPVFDDDENTEPSSQANSADQQRLRNIPDARMAGSFARFVQNTRIRFGSGDGGGGGLDEEDQSCGTLICGYLQKLGRNGKWQTRWFETDGECLSYYKSSKRNKLLATLDLEKVGAIEIDTSDDKGCSFTIQVLGRPYHLRAQSRASCKDWVITLNRVKEARMNQGNVKLVSRAEMDAALAHQHNQEPMDLLDHRPSDDMITPRVVVVANRQRTRAVDESQDWDQLIRLEGSKPTETPVGPYDSHKRRSTIGNVVLARWSKRGPHLTRLGAKLAKWARSLRKLRCREIDDQMIQLDRHVHPPGHDDRKHKSSKQVHGGRSHPGDDGDGGLSGWIGKETTQTARGGGPSSGGGPGDDEVDDEGIVEAPGVEPTVTKPVRAMRALSSGSEYDSRMIS